MHAAGDLRKAPLLLQDGDRPLVGRTRNFDGGGESNWQQKGVAEGVALALRNRSHIWY